MMTSKEPTSPSDGVKDRGGVRSLREVAVELLVSQVREDVLQAVARFNARDNAAHLVKVGGVTSTSHDSRAGRLDDALEGSHAGCPSTSSSRYSAPTQTTTAPVPVNAAHIG